MHPGSPRQGLDFQAVNNRWPAQSARVGVEGTRECALSHRGVSPNILGLLGPGFPPRGVPRAEHQQVSPETVRTSSRRGLGRQQSPRPAPRHPGAWPPQPSRLPRV